MQASAGGDIDGRSNRQRGAASASGHI